MILKRIVHGIAVLLIACISSVWSFTWTPPVEISVAGENASAPQVAVDPNGNAVSVWVRSNGSNNIVQAATKLFGQPWLTPIDLSVSGENASAPQVAVDPNGNAVAVWIHSNGVNNIAQAATKLFGQAWSFPPDNLSPVGNNASQPLIAVDSAGNAVAVWLNGTFDIIQSATKLFGQAWSAPATIPFTGSSLFAAQLAVDPAGNAIAICQAFNGSNTFIQASTMLFGQSWTASFDISPAGQASLTPQIAVDSAGNAVAVWVNTSNITIQAATKLFGQAWTTPPDNLSNGTPIEVVTPQVAVDPAGNAVAVWAISPNGSSLITQSATKPFGQAWTTPPDNLSLAGDFTNDPEVAMDSSGNAIAVWENTSNGNIQSAFKLFGQSWSAIVDVTSAGGNVDTPHVAMNPVENGVVVWTNELNPTTIQSSTTDFVPPIPPTPPLPPQTLVGKQVSNHFAMQSEHFNQLNWTVSPTPSTVGYRIYRNGVLLVQVPSFQLSYRDHLQPKKVAVTYSITTINSAGIESASTALTIDWHRRHWRLCK